MFAGINEQFHCTVFSQWQNKEYKSQEKPVIWEMVNIDKILLQLRKGLAAHLEFLFTNSIHSCHLQDRDLAQCVLL